MSTQDEHVALLQVEYEILIGKANEVLGQITENVDSNTNAWQRLQRQQSAAQKTYDDITGAAQKNATAMKDASSAVGQSATDYDKQSQSATKLSDSALPRLRYALYDVSFAAAASGAALLAGGVLVAKTADQYQALYADVARTYTGIQGLDKGVQLDNLRQQLLQITSDLPVTFDQVTKIATLGNQLGIPAAALKDFTETVAEFSATTNVSVDASATAFGRLGQLLHTTDFKGLGDDIAYLGVNAVATESQIIGVAQQISVSANAAGFSAKQTLALSTALASLGIAPEAARGSILRTFSEINAAVDAGGTKLNDLAAISGTTSADFASKWKSDASGAFTDFIHGLSNNTANAKQNLNDLGITAARDVQAVSLLAQNVNVLDQAQSDATKSAGYLDQSFGTINDTVSSKLEKLGNNVQRFFDTIGSTAQGPLAVMVDFLGGLVNLLNDIEKNPFTAWSTAAFLALGTLAGAGLLVFAALARIQGSMLAVATAGASMNEQGGSTSIIWDILTFKAVKLATANEAVAASNAAVAASEEAAAVTATTEAAANDALAASNAAVGASETAKAAATAEGAVATEAASATTSKLSGILGKAGLVGSILAVLTLAPAIVTALRDWADEMSGATQSADTLAAKFDDLAKRAQDTAASAQAIQSSKDALGYLTNRPDVVYDDGSGARQYTGAQLAVNKATTGSYTPGKDFNIFTGGASINDVGDKATAQVKAYDDAINKLIGDGNIDAAKLALNQFHAAMAAGGVSASDADKLLSATNATLGVTGEQGTEAAIGLKAAADAASTGDDAFKSYMDAAYAASNAQAQLQTDLDSLGQAFANNGADVAGNGKEIQAVISDIYATASSPQDAASQMQGFFNSLIQGGFATASQLSGLQAVIFQLTGGQGATGTPFDLSNLSGGFDKATASIQKTQSAASKAADQVHTLVDYSNDLGNVFKRALDIRFGGGQGLDAISKAWDDIKTRANDAQTAMAKANATLQQLASDKAINEYWLSVANMYGDTLRAAQIQATLAQNAQDTSAAQKDLAKAQDDSSKTLVGNSDAAIQNRASILGLVSNYESYIQTLAASGADQATLQATAARLKQEFMAQATQLGYNSTELGTYAAAFDDVTLAIGRVPRNITVAANTNPAIQALNELDAKARAISNTTYGGPTFDGTAAAKAGRAAQIQAQITALAASMLPSASTDSQISRNANLQAQIAQLTAKLNSGNYYTGGYTGDGGMYDYAGSVHKGEFVFDSVATRNAGPQALAYAQDMLRTGQGFSLGNGGGGGNGIMQLSPADRQLLQAIANRVGLTIGGNTLQRLAGASNVTTTSRGAA